MKLADLAIYLLTCVVALLFLVAVARFMWPPEPQLLIEASWQAQGCPSRPAPRPQGIPVQPSDARRLA